jgi:hypothetical protein
VLNIVCALLALTACSPAQPAAVSPERGLPLVAGTTWVYRGILKSWDSNAGKVVTVPLAWTMKVDRVCVVGRLTVAVMQGHPDDVAWGVPEAGPSRYLIVRDGGRYYRLQPEGPPIVPDSEAALRKLLHREDVVFELPLRLGQEFGREEGTRQPGWHCWVVESAGLARVAAKGLAPDARSTTYRIAYRTAPDHQILDIAEGIGIARFRYVHHGTVDECDLRLVELRRPRAGASAGSAQRREWVY